MIGNVALPFPRADSHVRTVLYGLPFGILSVLITMSADWVLTRTSQAYAADPGPAWEISPAVLVPLALLVAPIVETFLFQFMVFACLYHLGRPGKLLAIITSTFLFSLGHLGPTSAVQAILTMFSGFYDALIFACASEKSFAKAYLLTATTHFVHNLIVSGILLLSTG